VDPSSPVTGGSILGDKTRMERLSRCEDAFIRPSPSGGSLGGVAHRTREAMMLVEAAGFDVVIVETVGIGQSEVTVASMVDFFLVLLLPGGGDELQGIKKGVIELADGLVVNKADGDSKAVAQRTQQDYQGALDLIRPGTPGWKPRVLTASSLRGEGIDEVWAMVTEHRAALEESGELARKRRDQARAWLWSLLQDGLQDAFRSHPRVAERLPELEGQVERLEITPYAAAQTLLGLFAGS
jgi:LAO/AO transport system kinase